MLSLKESCTGLGALGLGAVRVGLRRVAVNELQPVVCRFLQLTADFPVVQGDIAEDAVLLKLWKAHPWPSCFAAGVSCQPDSCLGENGAMNSRALSLPAVLKAGLLMGAPCILIECVSGASKDQQVRTALAHFTQATGYSCSEVCLELGQVWVSRRCRWWVLLTRPDLGSCSLPAWTVSGIWKVVKDVLVAPLGPDPKLRPLKLTAYEAREFSIRAPLDTFLLPQHKQAPTALHSWGNQVTSCPCGCRAFPFTESCLDQGIHAQLVIWDAASTLQLAENVRHLSAPEAALLNGLDPALPRGPNPWLALCLVGQLDPLGA